MTGFPSRPVSCSSTSLGSRTCGTDPTGPRLCPLRDGPCQHDGVPRRLPSRSPGAGAEEGSSPCRGDDPALIQRAAAPNLGTESNPGNALSRFPRLGAGGKRLKSPPRAVVPLAPFPAAARDPQGIPARDALRLAAGAGPAPRQVPAAPARLTGSAADFLPPRRSLCCLIPAFDGEILAAGPMLFNSHYLCQKLPIALATYFLFPQDIPDAESEGFF